MRRRHAKSCSTSTASISRTSLAILGFAVLASCSRANDAATVCRVRTVTENGNVLWDSHRSPGTVPGIPNFPVCLDVWNDGTAHVILQGKRSELSIHGTIERSRLLPENDEDLEKIGGRIEGIDISPFTGATIQFRGGWCTTAPCTDRTFLVGYDCRRKQVASREVDRVCVSCCYDAIDRP